MPVFKDVTIFKAGSLTRQAARECYHARLSKSRSGPSGWVPPQGALPNLDPEPLQAWW